MVTGLITGTTYKFQVEARNTVGYSAKSAVYQIVAATVPSTPSTPATSIQNNAVTITWAPPAANGQTIIGYRIYVQQSDGTYSQSLATCDGSTFNVMVSTSCQITVQTLQAAPYNLASGAGVYAKVLAYNSIGDSLLSGVGNGAILVLSYVPGAPTLA